MTNSEIVERIAQGEDSRTQFKRGPVGVATDVELVSDSESNFFTAKIYRQKDAPVNLADTPVNGRAEPVGDADSIRILKIISENPGINKTEISRRSGIAVWTIKEDDRGDASRQGGVSRRTEERRIPCRRKY